MITWIVRKKRQSSAHQSTHTTGVGCTGHVLHTCTVSRVICMCASYSSYSYVCILLKYRDKGDTVFVSVRVCYWHCAVSWFIDFSACAFIQPYTMYRSTQCLSITIFSNEANCRSFSGQFGWAISPRDLLEYIDELCANWLCCGHLVVTEGAVDNSVHAAKCQPIFLKKCKVFSCHSHSNNIEPLTTRICLTGFPLCPLLFSSHVLGVLIPRNIQVRR